MIPLGVFLLEHIIVNCVGARRAGDFRRAAAALGGFPMVAAIEFVGIALPLVIHSVIGVLIATELPQRGSREWPTRARSCSARPGVLLLPYLIYHVWATRLSPDVLKHHADLFEVMRRQVSGAGRFAFHAAGVILAAWHLGNGLPGFVERWGFARTPPAARAAARIGGTLSRRWRSRASAALLRASQRRSATRRAARTAAGDDHERWAADRESGSSDVGARVPPDLERWSATDTSPRPASLHRRAAAVAARGSGGAVPPWRWCTSSRRARLDVAMRGHRARGPARPRCARTLAHIVRAERRDLEESRAAVRAPRPSLLRRARRLDRDAVRERPWCARRSLAREAAYGRDPRATGARRAGRR
jgi:succinate dehydrogenase / fumarate reductase cytochrome b subunit